MVTACVCADVSFASLREQAVDGGLTLAQLMDRTGCCRGCGLCEPYVRLMLRTGRTSFPVMNRETADELMSSPAGEFKHGRPERSRA
ncbi:MAG: bacterioferritin-associated ferredoxin [Phycisphaerales bacterium]